MTRALLAVTMTFAVGLVLVPAVRALARRVGMVAVPRSDRWHAQPTALLGGVGIFAAFALGAAVFPASVAAALPILAASTFLFAVGLVDDLVQIRPGMKLGAQVAAAAGIVASGLVLPWTHEPTVDAGLALVWIVGITNAINLLDNMDGLAAGIAVIACVFLGVTFATNGQWDLAVLPALLAGAAAAFLAYNFKPASIFMGDSGSMFLGCLLGGMALLSTYGRSRSIASVLLTPVLIMTIPILDTTLVTVTRRLRGQRVSVGGRDHTSHRLVALGASERRAVLILYVVAAVSGTVALVVREVGVDQLLAVIPAFALAVLFFALYVGMVPVRATGRTAVADGRLPTPRRLATGLLIDGLLAALSYLTAFGIRWDWDLPPDQLAVLHATLPLVVGVELVALWSGGLYRVPWHEPSIDALAVIGRTSVCGSALAALGVLVAYAFSGPSRGALVMNGVLLVLSITGSRLSVVLLRRAIAGADHGPAARQRVLMYGVDDLGRGIVEEILADPVSRLLPVGFVDDSDGGEREASGLPVFTRSEVPQVLTRGDADAVLVSRRDIDGEDVARLKHLGVPLRTVRVASE